MFDLDRAVREWREEMSRHEAIGVELLDELESHLLEELEGLRKEGLREEEAFERAVRQLGSGASVEDEIAKIDPDSVARARGRWILIGCLIGPLVLRGVVLSPPELCASPRRWPVGSTR